MRVFVYPLITAGLVSSCTQQAARNDGYKFISAHDGPEIVPWGTGIETGFSADEQLYDLNSDPGETINVASDNPDFLAEIRSLLDDVIQR